VAHGFRGDDSDWGGVLAGGEDLKKKNWWFFVSKQFWGFTKFLFQKKSFEIINILWLHKYLMCQFNKSPVQKHCWKQKSSPKNTYAGKPKFRFHAFLKN
jgi:hypothetical protein